MSKAINFYEKIPKKYLNQNKYTYDNQKEIKINLPLRALFCGPSGSMKSNALLNLLRTINGFDMIYLVAKQPDQALYRYLKDVVGESLVITDSLEELPPLSDFDSNISTLVVFDDWLGENEKDLKYIAKFFVKGRHKGVSVIFISQSYYACPSLIRKNSDLVFILKLNTKGDMSRFLKEYQMTDISIDKLIEIYNKIKAEGNQNWMLFDTAATIPEYRVRYNFTPIKL